jgi:hypothetical protein
MKTLLVKIKQCCHITSWYSAMIGEKFKVVDRGNDFVLSEDYLHERSDSIPWRHIEKADCEVVGA